MTNDIQQKIDELVQDYEQDLKVLHEKWIPSEPEDKILYHYTTLRNLKRIFEKKCFTYTHIEDLNDPSELYYALERTKLRISDVLKISLDQFGLEDMWDNFIVRFECNVNSRFLEENKNLFSNVKNINSEIYIGSYKKRVGRCGLN